MVATAVRVAVYCRNGLCPYALSKRKPALVGRIEKSAELRCPSCRKVDVYRA